MEEVSVCTFAYKYPMKGRYVWGVKSRPDFIDTLLVSVTNTKHDNTRHAHGTCVCVFLS